MSLNMTNEPWGLDIRDAGPPASVAFSAGWIGVTLLAYFLFTVVRPAAAVHLDQNDNRPSEDPDTHVPCRRKKSMWFPSQLFFTTWAWLALDCVHRTYCYLLLSPTMLWRRGMLPLAPDWSSGLWSSWVNQVRFVVHCRGIWPRATVSTESVQCRSYMLPTTQPGPAEGQDNVYTTVMPPFVSEAQREAEIHQFHAVAVYAVLTSLALLVAVAREVRRLKQSLDARRRAALEKETTQAAEVPHGTTETTSLDEPAFATAHSKFYVKGADDAWLNSPEAAAEYARWDAIESAERESASRTGMRVPRGSMHQVICDVWPTVLGVMYGGLYAATGGMPLLMIMVFPAVSVIAIATALYCSFE